MRMIQKSSKVRNWEIEQTFPAVLLKFIEEKLVLFLLDRKGRNIESLGLCAQEPRDASWNIKAMLFCLLPP